MGRKLHSLVLATTVAVGITGTASADVNWRQFEGSTLNAAYFTANYIDAWWRPMAKQFQNAGFTGRPD